MDFYSLKKVINRKHLSEYQDIPSKGNMLDSAVLLYT